MKTNEKFRSGNRVCDFKVNFCFLQTAKMPKRKRANPPKNSATESATALPANNKKTDILDLNDDCLREIFAHFNLTDLSAMKDACSRFGPVADEQFHRKFNHFGYTFCPEFDEHPTGNEYDISSSVFKNFGHAMSKLIVRKFVDTDAKAYWQKICENFTSLKELTVHSSNLSLFQPGRNPMHCGELDHLQIIDCSGRNMYFTRMIQFFGNVKRLRVRDGAIRLREGGLQCNFLQNGYPLLTAISLEFVQVNKHFREFAEKNPQLKKIFLKNCVIGYDKLFCIAIYCENIESISLEYYHRNENNSIFGSHIASLSRLNKLKELQFRGGEWIYPALETLAEKNLLETLGLSDGLMDNRLCRAICKFTNLHTLKLMNFNTSHLALQTAIRHALKLKHLHIIRCNNVLFGEIVYAIRAPNTLETVTFAHHYDWWVFDLHDFSALVQARTLSGAGFPLEFFLPRTVIERMTIGTDVIRSNAESIKLRQFDSFDEYLICAN